MGWYTSNDGKELIQFTQNQNPDLFLSIIIYQDQNKAHPYFFNGVYTIISNLERDFSVLDKEETASGAQKFTRSGLVILLLMAHRRKAMLCVPASTFMQQSLCTFDPGFP